MTWSPDGVSLASGSADKTIKVWNATTGNCHSTLSVDSGPCGVTSISYSPAGDLIAAGCGNGKIHLLDTATFAVKRSLTGHSSHVMSVAWNNDGTKLATGGWENSVKIWAVGSAGTFECQSTLSGHLDR